MQKIRVLVADDSNFIRIRIKEMLDSEETISVVGTADSADEVFDKIKTMKPDVLVLNIRMPGISGLDILYQVMHELPIPTILIGEGSELGKEEIITAFKYGAVDFVVKPDDIKNLPEIKHLLVNRIRTASSVDIRKLVVPETEEIKKAPKKSRKIVIIGASTGGPPAVEAVLKALPKDFPAPILVIQHMPSGFTASFAKRLDSICNLSVKEASEGDAMEPGRVLVAPGGFNTELRMRAGRVVVSLNRKGQKIKPSLDMAFESASKIDGFDIIGVVLTGMGNDGSVGAHYIKEHGGTMIAQNKTTSLIFGMPKAVIEEKCADFVLPLTKIPEKIIDAL